MNAETEHLVLEHLKAIRSTLDDHGRQFVELTNRMGRVEREIANLHTDFASLSVRLDGQNPCLERIEKRLELAPA